MEAHCPQCRQTMKWVAGHYHCEACQRDYRQLASCPACGQPLQRIESLRGGGLPVPERARADLKKRVNFSYQPL